MMIIDSHCHCGKGDGLTGPWDTRAPLESYLGWCAESGIAKTVLFAAFNSDYALANEAVAKVVMANPQRFYGYAFVNAARDAGRIAQMISKAVYEYGFVGIKVHRYDASISREICDVARQFKLPVLYDVMAEIAQIHLIAREYPDVNFIIPHLGTFSDDWKAQRYFIDPLTFYPNVYTDTSGVRRFDLLKEAYERAGAHKILFGSDGPWLHPGVELAKVLALTKDKNDLRKMLSENFLRLMGKTTR
jgi:uncharacterized protein